jgi:crotonobetainyl-CoA:carnitine CoA-transferase CaiB-like acyl-CoA transferase
MLPLTGVKVLEFSTMITASFAAMMMAEQGADVIKVEPVELGDPMRYLGSSKGGISGLFANCNRGKRSLRIDIKSDVGREVIQRLAADTDVLLCNFRPGVMDSLGLGAAALRDINPRLIYAAINGFGNAGPHADKPAYDPVIQAQAGFTAVQGEGSSGPQFVRNLVCDKITAYTACQAVTAALYQREKTGSGQLIELSMMDAGLYFLFPDGFMHQTLLDPDVEHAPPLSRLLYEMTLTRDGAITVSAANEAQQVGLLTAIEQLHLFADERFNSMEKIVANITEFRAVLRDAMGRFTTKDLLQRLAANNVPAAECLTYEDVLAHPQYAANDAIDRANHPRMGTLRRVKPPARFSGQRLAPAAHAAAHGEHTREILGELGYDAGYIAELVAGKIAGDANPA